MRYKGFDINPVYHAGSDFVVTRDGSIKSKKQTSKDIAYYEVTDPLENDRRQFAENTIPECKDAIDELLVKLGAKKNIA